MKNKTKTYILLTLVLLIWSIIGFKIFSTINPSIPQNVDQDIEVAFNPRTNTTVDTFSIQVSKRDPFLGTLLIKKKPIKRTSKKTTNKAVVWVPILYHGSISKQNTKTKVFVISISGQQHLMKLGQTINDVTLIRGHSKNIVVTYKGLKKTIQKT